MLTRPSGGPHEKYQGSCGRVCACSNEMFMAREEAPTPASMRAGFLSKRASVAASGLHLGGDPPRPASAAGRGGWQRLSEGTDWQGGKRLSSLDGGAQWLGSAPGRAQDVRTSDSVRGEMRSVLQPVWCREIAVATLLRCAVTGGIALLHVLPSLDGPAPAGTGLLLSLDVAIMGLALAQRCGVAVPSFGAAMPCSCRRHVVPTRRRRLAPQPAPSPARASPCPGFGGLHRHASRRPQSHRNGGACASRAREQRRLLRRRKHTRHMDGFALNPARPCATLISSPRPLRRRRPRSAPFCATPLPLRLPLTRAAGGRCPRARLLRAAAALAGIDGPAPRGGAG